MARQLFDDPEGNYYDEDGTLNSAWNQGGASSPTLGAPIDALDLPNLLGGTLGAGLTAFQPGLANLMEILGSQGKTDPGMLNRQLVANARNTEAQQQRQTGSAARRGLQNSGVSQAINAAIGASGADRDAAIRTRETAMAEKRKRSDLDLLFKLLGLAAQESRTQAILGEGAANRKDAKKNLLYQALGQGVGSDSAKSLLDFITSKFEKEKYDSDDPDSFWYIPPSELGY